MLACLHGRLLPCLSSCLLRACLHRSVLACLIAWLLTCVLTYLPACLQAGVLLAIFLTLRRMSEATRGLQRRMEEQVSPIPDNVDEITTTVRESSRSVLEDIAGLSRDARRQVQKFDALTDELADRVRLQIIRLDQLLSQALSNLERAGTAVRENVVGPVREATAVIQGVKAAIDFLAARRERRGRQQSDEELFI